jgi:hypothetical protein
MTENRVGEIIESSTTDFAAQCYELYQSPALGSLVKATMSPQGNVTVYGLVYQSVTTSLDPGRRAIARGKDEVCEEDVYRGSPQLEKLLRTEFRVLIAGHRAGNKLFQYLPPNPPRIHSFVFECTDEERKDFGRSFDFLNVLMNARLTISPEELAAAVLRQISTVYPDPDAYLVAAGKELALLLNNDFNRLKAVLGRIKP